MLRSGDFAGVTFWGFFRRMAWLSVTERNGEALNGRDGVRTGDMSEHLDNPRKSDNMAYWVLVTTMTSKYYHQMSDYVSYPRRGLP